jgi:MFS family permease
MVTASKNSLFQKNSFYPAWIWVSGAIFYIYQYILRMSSSIMVDDLMHSFKIDASELAHLSSLSMYSYAIMQIPAGLLIDRLGIRTIQLFSISMCLSGTSLFIASHQLWVAELGRVLIGIGGSSAFICINKISCEYFPPLRRSFLIGLALAAGTVGAYSGSNIIAFFIKTISWQKILFYLNFFGIFSFLLSWFFIPSRSSQKYKNSSLFSELMRLTFMKEMWIYSIIALGVYLCMSVIADLWGISFIINRFNVEKQLATNIVSLMYIGTCLGSLILSFLADYLQNKLFFIKYSTYALFFFTGILIFCPLTHLFLFSFLFLIIGFLCGSTILCYSRISEYVPQKTIATTTGFMNCIVMLSGAWIAEKVGHLLDFFWKGALNPNGTRWYSIENYQKSLSLILIVMVFSVISTFFMNQDRPVLKE